MLKLFCTATILSLSIQMYAQIELEIDGWKNFLPYKKGNWVTQSKQEVFYTTGISLFSIDKNDLSPKFIDKNNGLTEVGIDLIEYDNYNNRLVVVYSNSNIDLYTDLNTINIPDIKNNTAISGAKQISNIHIHNSAQIFFGAEFGIIELNSDNVEFGATIFTESAVHDITSSPEKLYASTENGIYWISLNEGKNIADFNQWKRIGIESGLEEEYTASEIVYSNDTLYIVINEEILRAKEGEQFFYLDNPHISEQNVQYISPTESGILIGTGSTNPNSKVFDLSEENSIREISDGCANYTVYGIKDELGRYWLCDLWSSIRYIDELGSCQKIDYNTVKDEKVSDIAIRNDHIFIATGGANVEKNFGRLDGNNSGMYHYNGLEWDIFDDKDFHTIEGNPLFRYIYQVEIDRNRNVVYIGSYFEGLLEYNYENKENVYYDSSNSLLQGIIGDNNGREHIGGLAFDSKNNLWINNTGASRPLIVKDNEGNWYSYHVNTGRGLVECIVDDSDLIWSLVAFGDNGILVYDYGSTLEDIGDDRQKYLQRSNSNIEGAIRSIAKDLDGQIWVGTEKGPLVFSSGQSVFSSDNKGDKILVQRDSIFAYLLETEDIRAIEVDGGNRKWFGTTNGIYVQSPDGMVEIAHYTSENSPLLNNVIRVLKYDGNTGNMYIATDFGLQVLRTKTLYANPNHTQPIVVFPNPVTMDNADNIYIKGLAQNAIVKITDLNGRLVYETRAQGGLASWNGRDYSGNLAVNGVYYIFSSPNSFFGTEESNVSKFVIMR